MTRNALRKLFDDWCNTVVLAEPAGQVIVLTEKKGGRNLVSDRLLQDIYTADSSLKTVNVFSYPDGRRLRSIQLSVVPAGLAISPAHM